MFKHQHLFPSFMPESATKLIVGMPPPPRITTGELKPDVGIVQKTQNRKLKNDNLHFSVLQYGEFCNRCMKIYREEN